MTDSKKKMVRTQIYLPEEILGFIDYKIKNSEIKPSRSEVVRHWLYTMAGTKLLDQWLEYKELTTSGNI